MRCRKCATVQTHPGRVILIAFPPQKWLRERASMLRYMYIACLVIDMYTFNFLTRVLFQFQSFSYHIFWYWQGKKNIYPSKKQPLLGVLYYLIAN